MDDVFQILIYALIIISFLSSLFKKKKPVKSQGTSPQQPQRYMQKETETEVSTESGKNYDYDLMKEFENFFKVEGEKESEPSLEKSTPPESIQPSLERSTPIEIEQRKKDLEKSWHQKTESEHRYTNIWERKKAEADKKTARINSDIEKQAAEFEKHLMVKGSTANQISRNIRERLLNPSALKDYIIISEIIGKPKALRN